MGSEVIEHEVVGVSFGVYDALELQALSVCQLSNGHTFDSLHQPVPGGLYDERMGPLNPHDRCVTCHQPQSACLGHVGHLSLTLPVYQPVLFDLCFKLLKAQCWLCHRLKLGRLRVQRVLTKLQLVEAGQLQQAQMLDEQDGLKGDEQRQLRKATAERKRQAKAKAKKDRERQKKAQQYAPAPKSSRKAAIPALVDEQAKKEDDDEVEEEEEEGGEEREEDGLPSSTSSAGVAAAARLQRLSSAASAAYTRHVRLFGQPPPLTSAALEYRSALLSAFIRDIQQRRCLNCGGYSPRLRKDGHSKIFRLPLVRKEQQHNDLHHLTLDTHNSTSSSQQLPGALAQQQRSFDDEEKLLHHLSRAEKASAAGSRAQSKAARTAAAGKQGRGSARGAQRSGRGRKTTEDDSGESSGESSEEDVNGGGELDVSDDEGGRPLAGEPDRSLVADDERALQVEVELAAESRRVPVLMFPSEVEAHLERLWAEEGQVLGHVCGSVFNAPRLKQSRASPVSHSLFFVRVLAVPPSRFRPPSLLNGVESDHPHNAYLKLIIEADARIRRMAMGRPQRSGAGGGAADSAARPSSGVSESGVLDWSVLIESWLSLQEAVNALLDSSKSSTPNAPQDGVRQLFEKKEGLFRRNMMGKRVNFAARSVISPDPFLSTNEIGVPEMFATQLTFPEPVTAFNVHSLRQAVVNGPDVHPGAVAIEDERGQLISLAHKSPAQRSALSKTLLTTTTQMKGGAAAAMPLHIKRVLRHIRSGDVMLVNRQPTLHKPSMMTHRVRVLRGRNKMWQTIRMHYANCNSYNADFDGDEMNLHFCQNQLARAEAYTISNTDQQYLVPTDGSPLRGLIQDNVLTGVLLTQLDTFLTRAQFQQLLFCCVEVLDTLPLSTPRPALLKPQPLFTGKQLIGALLQLLTHGRPALNLVSKAKVPASNWKQHVEEGVVIIRGNVLCTGVLDKSQFGDAGYGLVHAVYELYGANTAGQLLSTLGRLFTLYLQSQAFTCGIDDMLIVGRSEAERTRLIHDSVSTGLSAALDFAQLSFDPAQPTAVHSALQRSLREPQNVAKLDSVMKGALNPFTSNIISACLPAGQLKPFPLNGMSLMTLSGAKGSAVNFSQISCLLGQQELEGKRVPHMATGKTLPSFRKYDPQPRAGGYVTDRFLTGIRPAEYYFHCMAGREGLIDTAVKTSRSGYLQRCLIKHLESLTVQYDHTVRDSDSSVVQFLYGEDSVDINRTAYLQRFDFLTHNWRALLHKLNPPAAIQALDTKAVEIYEQAAASSYSAKQKQRQAQGEAAVPLSEADPVLSVFSPGAHLGAVSDAFRDAMAEFVREDRDGLFLSSSTTASSPTSLLPRVTADKFRALMHLNYLHSLVQPGESVGILAAQSVGEPSTQMTLNTFHLAGHGGANVTLGIPRLREIIMTASARIRTPIMEVPMRNPKASRAEAEEVAATLTRLTLPAFLTSASVRESVEATERGASYRLYTVRLTFPEPSSAAVQSSRLVWRDFELAFAHQFCVRLNAAVKREVKLLMQQHAVSPVIVRASMRQHEAADAVDAGGAAEGGDASDAAEGGGGRMRRGRGRGVDEDAVSAKERRKHHEEVSYEEPDEDELAIIQREERQREERDKVEDEDEDDEDQEEDAAVEEQQRLRMEHKYDEAEGKAGEADDGDAVDEEKAESSSSTSSDSLWLHGLLNRCSFLRAISFDPKQQWAEVVVSVSLSLPKLLMMSVVESLVEGVLLRSTPGISRAFVVEKSVGGVKQLSVATDGLNFREVALYSDVLDVDRLYSNDIAAILRQYGVEAARTAICKEVQAVFAPYGISVDYRHVALIADYMTCNGEYRALNRGGIDSNTSTFQKISFETSMHFLREAALLGDTDSLHSPSANIVVGKPVTCGTGAFTLMQPIPHHTAHA